MGPEDIIYMYHNMIAYNGNNECLRFIPCLSDYFTTLLFLEINFSLVELFDFENHIRTKVRTAVFIKGLQRLLILLTVVTFILLIDDMCFNNSRNKTKSSPSGFCFGIHSSQFPASDNIFLMIFHDNRDDDMGRVKVSIYTCIHFFCSKNQTKQENYMQNIMLHLTCCGCRQD